MRALGTAAATPAGLWLCSRGYAAEMRSKTIVDQAGHVLDLARSDAGKLIDRASDSAVVLSDRAGGAVHVLRDRVADLDLSDLPIPAVVPVIGRRRRRRFSSPGPALWAGAAVTAALVAAWWFKRRKAAADDRDLAKAPSPVTGVPRSGPAARAS